MGLNWQSILTVFDRYVPDGSPRRKLLQVVAVVLLFEGVSVVILFSKAGILAGILSMILGLLLLLLIRPGQRLDSIVERSETPGIKLIRVVVNLIGGEFVLAILGAMVIALVLLYNRFVSLLPGLGDLDTLSLLFGGVLVIYPFVRGKFKAEVSFSLLFLAFVVVFLVFPQAIMSADSGSASSIGNWYVHYMLVAPFAGILSLIGIDASSSGSYVTIQFVDGTFHTLGVSAYCAGLYSFSIFLASFFSFVLVFERLRNRTLVVIMGLGLLIAYLGNLFRMVVIGVVGYYRGMDALLWAHVNAGWIIFLAWSAVFWYLLLRYVSRPPSRERNSSEVN